MDSSVYDIYFQGEALEGFDINLVKQNMAKLFQANAQTLAALFSGKTVLLKKDLGKDDALKYQTLLKKAGAKIVIKARRVDAPAPAPSPAQATPQPQAAKPAAPAANPRQAPTAEPAAKTPATAAVSPASPAAAGNAAPSWSLSPAGSDLLKPEERHEVAAVQVDTSALSVAALSPMPQVHKAEPPPPDTSSLSIAAVGTTLGTGEREKANARAIVPDVNFGVAEAGARLAEESIEIPLPEPDLSQLSLAAVGSRLGTESKEPPPKAPDTSHLSVAPQK
jgi:hypothetical protein